jgi:PelA/Pel-15E family pectate lyase
MMLQKIWTSLFQTIGLSKIWRCFLMSMTLKKVTLKGAVWLLVLSICISAIPFTSFAASTSDPEAKMTALADHLTREIRVSQVANTYSAGRSISTSTADNVVSWQLDYNGLGGWSKNFDDRIYSRKYNGSEAQSYQTTQNKTVYLSTLDNDATTSHMQYLAAVYGQHGGDRYRTSVRKAMDMILHMQNSNGGWPEMYPEQTWAGSDFENHSTINDDVHYRVMSMMQKILNNQYPFNNNVFDAAYKQKIQASYDKGLDFLIKAQLKKNDGTPTLWAAKYNKSNYTPMWARHFEPPVINNRESQMILFFLLSVPNKSVEVKKAIYYGAMWMHENVTMNLEYRWQTSPYFFNKSGAKLWYRFQDPNTGRAVYAENNKTLSSIMDLSTERRHGYGWATNLGYQICDATGAFLSSYKDQSGTQQPAPQPQPEPQPPSGGSGGGSGGSTQPPQEPVEQPSSGGSGGSGSTSRDSQRRSTTTQRTETETAAAPAEKGVAFTVNASTFVVDGERQLMDAAPYIKDGRMMIPVRHLEALFGVKPFWNNNERSVSINFGGTNYKVIIGSRLLTANNAPLMELDVSAEILRSRTFVPASRFARAMGIEYKYDELTRTATFI